MSLLLAAKIDDESGTVQTPRDPVRICQRFMRARRQLLRTSHAR
jgi:hypothetical protein